MNAIEFINTLKPLLADYQAAVDREAQAADDKAGAGHLINLLFRELPEDERKAIWEKPFMVFMPEGGAFQVIWGNGLQRVAKVARTHTLKELLPQEGGADAT